MQEGSPCATSLLSFCVSQRFWPLHAALFLRWEAGERQWHYEAEQELPTASQAAEFLDSVLLSLVMRSRAHCLTLLKPKNKVLLYIKSPGRWLRPLQSSLFKNEFHERPLDLVTAGSSPGLALSDSMRRVFSPDLSVLDPELGGNLGLAAPRQTECGSFHPSPP